MAGTPRPDIPQAFVSTEVAGVTREHVTIETKYTFCRICESLCGLEVEVEKGAVRAIRPDGEHVTTRGFACPKGLYQHELYASPDRLERPRRRGEQGWADVGWDAALGEIGARVRRIVEESGPDAVAMYVGTAAGFGVLHPIFAQGFMTGLGSKNMYASATQDCANKFAVAHRMYGFPFTLPFPDVARTRCLIIVGANPMVSKWSFLQVPNPRRQINDIKARGGRVIVVDPRRTETAKAAGEHVFIRPGTDLAFYLAFLHELIASGGVDEDLVTRHTSGFEEIRALCESFPAERAASITGIDAETLRSLVHAYRVSDGAALYCSTGVNMSRDGTLAYWIQEVINAVSGNLDRAGGSLVAKGVIDFARFGRKHNLLVKDDRSRIGGFAKTNDAFPGGILADEILTPGRGQIRALFVTGGNPLMTMADADKLKQAFASLDLLVSLDIQPSETAQAGHFMLPCTSPLERPDLPFIFPLMLGLQTRPYLQATDAVVDPPGEARDEATIYLDLAAACGRPLFGSRMFQGIMRSLATLNRLRLPRDATYAALPQRGLLGLLLKICGQPGFKRLLAQPHGWLRPDHEPGSFLGQRVYTDDGRVALAPSDLLTRARDLIAGGELDPVAELVRQPGRYRMITRRSVTTHNSWTHNYAPFLRGDNDRNYLYMHSRDMAREGFAELDSIDIASSTGRICLQVRPLDDLMPGVVAVPHGWGHQDSGLSIARQAGGANVNVLHASGPAHVDDISGMSTLTGVPVRLVRANDSALV